MFDLRHGDHSSASYWIYPTLVICVAVVIFPILCMNLGKAGQDLFNQRFDIEGIFILTGQMRFMPKRLFCDWYCPSHQSLLPLPQIDGKDICGMTLQTPNAGPKEQ